jgi:hypothetical protein
LIFFNLMKNILNCLILFFDFSKQKLVQKVTFS